MPNSADTIKPIPRTARLDRSDGWSSSAETLQRRIRYVIALLITTPTSAYHVFSIQGVSKFNNQRVICNPTQMPTGQPKSVKATPVSELVLSTIKLRAAKKLIGIAIRVPMVVASNAMKTVSMILSQVATAVPVNLGAPTLMRAIAVICWASATGCRVTISTSAIKYPLASVSKLPICLLTLLTVKKLIGPFELGIRLNPSTITISLGEAQETLVCKWGPDWSTSGSSSTMPSSGQGR